MPVDRCPFCGLPLAQRPGEGLPDKCAFDCPDWRKVFAQQEREARQKGRGVKKEKG